MSLEEVSALTKKCPYEDTSTCARVAELCDLCRQGLTIEIRQKKRRYTSSPRFADYGDGMLAPGQVAQRLGVGLRKVLSWINNGELPAISLGSSGSQGNRYRIAPKDLEAFIIERRTRPGMHLLAQAKEARTGVPQDGTKDGRGVNVRKIDMCPECHRGKLVRLTSGLMCDVCNHRIPLSRDN